MSRLAVMAAVLGISSPALADRLAIGASIGKSGGKTGGDTGEEISTRGVFARVMLGERASIFGELGGATLEDLIDSTWTARRGVVGARLDLSRDRWTPYVLLGIGAERWRGGGWDAGTITDYSIRELGGGIDLALDRTVSIGLDLRFGERTLEQSRFEGDVVIAILPPSPPIGTDYTALRLTLTAKL
jgi:hypothetical protein